MGTRSTIALEYADGTVHQVYCHWDGYLEHNGQILQEHYLDPFKLRKLIDLGAISSLNKEIGIQHPFNDRRTDDGCVIYARDRGEDLRVNKFKDFADYVANHQYEEYDYILRNIDGKAVWFVCDHDGAYVTLESAIMDEQDRIAQEEAA